MAGNIIIPRVTSFVRQRVSRLSNRILNAGDRAFVKHFGQVPSINVLAAQTGNLDIKITDSNMLMSATGNGLEGTSGAEKANSEKTEKLVDISIQRMIKFKAAQAKYEATKFNWKKASLVSAAMGVAATFSYKALIFAGSFLSLSWPLITPSLMTFGAVLLGALGIQHLLNRYLGKAKLGKGNTDKIFISKSELKTALKKWGKALKIPGAIALAAGFGSYTFPGIGTIFPFIGAKGLSMSTPFGVSLLISFIEMFGVALGTQGIIYKSRWGAKARAQEELNASKKPFNESKAEIRKLFYDSTQRDVLASMLQDKESQEVAILLKDVINDIELLAFNNLVEAQKWVVSYEKGEFAGAGDEVLKPASTYVDILSYDPINSQTPTAQRFSKIISEPAEPETGEIIASAKKIEQMEGKELEDYLECILYAGEPEKLGGQKPIFMPGNDIEFNAFLETLVRIKTSLPENAPSVSLINQILLETEEEDA